MNRKFIPLFLFLMVISVPAALLIHLFTEYQVVSPYPMAAFFLAAALFSALAAVYLRSLPQPGGWLISLAIWLMPPLSVVNLFISLLWIRSLISAACFILWLILSLVILYRSGKRDAYRLTSSVLTSILMLPFFLCSFLFLFFGSIGQTTVVQEIDSPDGTRCARILDIDQGALGGDTAVEVHENSKRIDLILIAVEKKPQRVYLGPWGEFEDMEVLWENDHLLVIDGVSYEIS